MKKNRVRGLVMLFILFAIFSVIAFSVPSARNTCFILSYEFGVIALVLQIYVFAIASKGGRSVKSRYYGFPIARVGLIYLILQLLISLVGVIASKYIPCWAIVITSAILLGVCALGLIATDIAREEIVNLENVEHEEIKNIRKIQASVNALQTMCSDKDLKKEVTSLAEAIRYSDPISTLEPEEIEVELQTGIEQLRTLIKEEKTDEAMQFSKELEEKLNERNAIVKVSKQTGRL